jgi:hypothetical protein
MLGLMNEGVRGYAVDPVAAEALWKKSEEMVGEVFAQPDAAMAVSN